ncbi:MAG: hypothetical protein AAF291_08810 [Pseudomonadota bacterium]
MKWLAEIISFLAQLISGPGPIDSTDLERKNIEKRKNDYEAWKKEHGSDWNKLK